MIVHDWNNATDDDLIEGLLTHLGASTLLALEEWLEENDEDEEMTDRLLDAVDGLEPEEDRARDLVMRICEGLSAGETALGWCDARWYEDWAAEESDHAPHGLVTADWNRPSRWNSDKRRSENTGPQPLAGDMLERLGLELDWCDTVTACDVCHKAVRTEPTHYGWRPRYWQDDCETVCLGCIREDEEQMEAYVESLRGSAHAADLFDMDFSARGYVKVDWEGAHGLHPGQAANPNKVAEYLESLDVYDYIFQVTSIGQFDMHFTVWVLREDVPLWAVKVEKNDRWAWPREWVHESDSGSVVVLGDAYAAETVARAVMAKDLFVRAFPIPYFPDLDVAGRQHPSPAEVLSAALKSIPKGNAPDGHVRVHSIRSDGTVTTKDVSNEDFIAGKALD